ncbi:MAG: AAA family ATPase [Planctomycetota bacterium]
MSALDEILAWSKGLGSSWIRDALRRIVTQAEISEADVEELASLCKKPHGLSETAAVMAPLAADHLPASGEGGAVSLAALTHVSDVNALVPNETVSFGAAGLTVIYGDNGAGKSGYARILKRACRARGSSEPILANALSEKPAGTPTAKLVVSVAGVTSEHVWKDGAPGPAELGAVSVFDASAAQVYVSDMTEVWFRPLGLDVLDKLAGVCARVKARLEGERNLLQAQAASWPDIPKETQAGQLLGSLTALTSREQVDRVATLSDAEMQELENLSEILAAARLENPAKKASDFKVKASRLRRLADELKLLAEALGEQSMTRLVTLRADATSAARIAEDAARTFAGQAALQGVGTQEWREMWESARAYSETHAYPEHSFPHEGAGAHCVLCEQTLDRAAAERLTRFEEFVRGAALADAAAKRTAAEEAGRKCLAVVPGERTRDALDDLAVLDTAVSGEVKQFIDEARRCGASIREGTPAPSPVASVPPSAALGRLAAALDARAEEMTKAADPAGRERSEARHAELHARSVLAEIRPQIHAEIVRKARMNAYELCIRDTDTRAATKLSTDLTKKYVTDALTAAFDDELKRIGFTTLELELRPAGAQRGVLYHQVFLRHATKAKLPKVVSEGESRCIALAAFLAEVRGAANTSAIVFDDPVSSLDHRWRSNVSRRLVEESKTRQVIVFTHEMVFLAALLQEAERQKVPYSPHTISRGSDLMAGHVEHGLPWTGLPTGKRISALKQEWQRAEKIHREQGPKAYDPVATRMYADLRRTWERAVEEVLLNEVVLRFRQGIETNRLKKLGDITADDLKAVEAGMTKCSKWEGGHDQALAVNEPLPAPAELKTDIEQLEGWVAAVRKRRS